VQPSYFVYAVVEGKDPLKIIGTDNAYSQEPRRQVKESVDTLNAVLNTGGVDKAIRTFLTPIAATNGAN